MSRKRYAIIDGKAYTRGFNAFESRYAGGGGRRDKGTYMATFK